jgi:hypothetical protein
MTKTAHCSCGALRVEVSADPDAVVACAIAASVNGEPVRCSALVPTSRRKMFAPKDRPKSMSVMGRRGESSECIFARPAERRCSGKPT